MTPDLFADSIETVSVVVTAPLDGPFDYLLPQGRPRPAAGQVVAVPFGRQVLPGVVWDYRQDRDIEPGRLRPLGPELPVPPLPLPSASTVLGVPLILISIHLALFGEGALLPPRLASASIPRSVFVAAARYLAPAFRWLEGISRPRWLWLARRERLVGIICLYLAIILILPIPLLNSPPAACLAAVALGMIQRDGVFIVGGILGGLIVTGVLIGVIDAAGSFFLR